MCWLKIGFFIIDNFFEDSSKTILFGVLDGHGGRIVADHIIKNF